MTDKILIADDEELIRDITNSFLIENFPQFGVESFENGTSLENRLNGNTDDVRLVITDNNMPGITGSEIIERYATRLRFKDTPFILCYGGEDKIGKKAIENGAFGYISKCSKAEVYIDIIKRALKLE